jgi:hypothetical protein
MKKYYISDGKEKFGPLTIDELRSYSIDENTLIWYKGLEKWKYAKSVPEILKLIEDKKNESQSEILPDPTDKPIKKDNTLKYIVSTLAIVLIAIIAYEIINKSYTKNQKEVTSISVYKFNKSSIVSLLNKYYNADKNRNYNSYEAFYSFPIKNYFNNKNVTQEDLKKMVTRSWSLTSDTKNTPDYDNLNFEFNDNIYIVNYPLKFEYTLKKNGIKYINTYDATIKLNNEGKIFYINNIKTTSKKINYNTSFFKEYEGQYPENTIFNNENLISRLYSILGLNYNFMIKNWNNSSKIFLKNNSIYTYGCKSGECEDTNFTIVLDLNNDELFVGFKHRNNLRKYNEKNGFSERLNYWYGMNEQFFDTSN